ncbi:Copine [Gracilaria domingensis]|nr:Copine [Gracilaria domingensis]
MYDPAFHPNMHATPSPYSPPFAPPHPQSPYSQPMQHPSPYAHVMPQPVMPGYPPSFGSRPPSMGPPSLMSRSSTFSNSAKVAHITLELSATGLRKKDLVGTSDPICNVYIPSTKMIAPTSANINWVLYASTEMIANTTSPSWVNRIQVPYYFEQYQPLKFEVIDVDNVRTNRGDFLGQIKTNLAELVTKQNSQLKLADRTFKPGNYGVLNVTTHDDSLSTKVRVSFQFAGKKLDKKDFLGLSDPYFKISMQENSRLSAVYRSKYIRKNLNPAWLPDSFMLHTNGEPWNQVRLVCEVYDWDRYTPHDLIGEAKFTLQELRNSSFFQLINPKKVNRPRYVNSGELVVHRVDVVQMPTFTQFLLGGLRLEFIVAVDFTSSNRPVSDPQSLHYMGDPAAPSQYWQALHAIGTILEGYVPDAQFTALGFGAILPGQNTASFDFALSGQVDARVVGVKGLLDAYHTALQNVTLSGPTNFAPLIRNAMGLCLAQPVAQNNQHFCVLLIITDGVISDMPSTVDTIIEASHRTPIAIVIVGVGNADFASMQRLDGDNQRLTSNDGARKAKHDIVQFTPFKPGQPVEELAENVLQEVPQRVVDYMVDAGISPGV